MRSSPASTSRLLRVVAGFQVSISGRFWVSTEDGQGRQRSYLATDENFRVVSELHKNNAIVPLVGDFGGPKTIRAVGRYLNDHGAKISAFYTSNVEMYLFQSDAWEILRERRDAARRRQRHVLRSVSNRGYRFQNAAPDLRSSTRLSSIADLLKAFQSGKVEGYYDIIAMSH